MARLHSVFSFFNVKVNVTLFFKLIVMYKYDSFKKSHIWETLNLPICAEKIHVRRVLLTAVFEDWSNQNIILKRREKIS